MRLENQSIYSQLSLHASLLFEGGPQRYHNS